MSGRRGAKVEDASRWVFNRLADSYLSRPAYPASLVDRLTHLAREGNAAPAVADLGAGTGHLAIPLAERGLAVTAVEPAQRMLEALQRAAAERGVSITRVHAPAEQTGLAPGSVDLALCADALHWIDVELAGAECARILRPGGALAVVEVELLDSPFFEALWPKLEALNRKARPRAPDHQGLLTQLFALAAPRASVQAEALDDEVILSAVAAAQAVRSLSFVGPALSPAALEEVSNATLEVARHGAQWRRRLHLHWVRV